MAGERERRQAESLSNGAAPGDLSEPRTPVPHPVLGEQQRDALGQTSHRLVLIGLAAPKPAIHQLAVASLERL
jgi:hypothetical protein